MSTDHTTVQEPQAEETCLFENIFTATEATWRDLGKGSAREIKMYWLIAGSILAAVAVILAILGSLSGDVLLLIFAVAAAIGAVYFIFFHAGREGRKLEAYYSKQERLKNAGMENEFRDFGLRCYENHFESLRGSKHSYGQITSIVTGGEHTFVMLDRLLLFIVKTDAFTIGDYDTFISFVTRHAKDSLHKDKKSRYTRSACALVGSIVIFSVLILSAYQGRTPRRLPEANISERGTTIIEHDGNVFFQIRNSTFPGARGTGLYRRTPEGETILMTEIPSRGSIQFIDDMLYIGLERGIYKINPSDGTITRISDVGGDCIVFTPEWIYTQWRFYSSATGWHGGIYRVRPDGSGLTLLLEGAGIALQKYEGRLFYICIIENALVSMNPDGTNREILMEGMLTEGLMSPSSEDFLDLYVYLQRVSNSRIQGGWLYYINADNRLYRVQLNGRNRMSLNARVQAFAFLCASIITLDFPTDGELMTTHEDASMSTMFLDGTGQRKIILHGGGAPVVAGDYIYFYQLPFRDFNEGALWRVCGHTLALEFIY